MQGAQLFSLGLPELSTSLAPTVQLRVPASAVGTFRLVVQGMPDDADGQEPLHLHLRNALTGAAADYTALFLSPAKGQ